MKTPPAFSVSTAEAPVVSETARAVRARGALLHLAYGVRDERQWLNQVRSFADFVMTPPFHALLEPLKQHVWVGDRIEKGNPVPDRATDRTGAPLFLAITDVMFEADAMQAENRRRLIETGELFAGVAQRVETWAVEETYRADPKVDTREAEQRVWLQIVMMNIVAAAEEEFNDWYEKEHIERISAVPHFRGVRRMYSADVSPRYIALWKLAEPRAPEKEPWLSASETPWTRRIRRFMRDRQRFVFSSLQDTG